MPHPKKLNKPHPSTTTDLEFMNRPDDWPRWPFLPLKRYGTDYLARENCGALCVTAKPVPPVVYLMNV